LREERKHTRREEGSAHTDSESELYCAEGDCRSLGIARGKEGMVGETGRFASLF